MFFQILLKIVAFSGIVYLALSKKSSPLIRKTAICTLALMVLAVIICLFVLFGSNTASTQIQFDVDSTLQPEPSSGISGLTLLLFIIFFLALFMFVFFISLRDKKKAQLNKTGKAAVYKNNVNKNNDEEWDLENEFQ